MDNVKVNMKEIEALCTPIVEYLKENYDPYTNVIITYSNIRVTEDIMGIPSNVSNTE